MDRLKIKILMVSICLLAYTTIFPQAQYDYNWALKNTIISFSGDTITIKEDIRIDHLLASNITFNTDDGKFIGYSNGCRIFDENSVVVEETDSLNFSDPSFVYEDFCLSQFHSGYQSGRQGLMILPSDSSLFLLHEITDLNLEGDFFGFTENVFFSELSFEHNLLELVSIQNPILEEGIIGIGAMSAVKTADNIGWWIIKNDLHSNCYYSILFDGTNFTEQELNCIGNDNTVSGNGGVAAVFSPDGEKYARFSPSAGLFLFNFDRSTGELSNYELIEIPQTGLSGGLSFSPSGQFLYVSDPLFIRQYDVWSEDVAESEVIVAEYDGFIGNSLGQGTTFAQMQLAPDCRIYINTGPNLSYMHIIMRPDEKGIACDVKQHSIDLPFPNSRNLPYFPNYRLDTDEPLCDSTKVIVLNGTMPPVATVDLQGEVKVFPNPASHFINVLLDKKGDYTMSIMDMAGLQVLAVETSQAEVTIDVRGLSVGIYVLQVLDSNTGKRMVKKVMVK
jgi:hypothetical protein